MKFTFYFSRSYFILCALFCIHRFNEDDFHRAQKQNMKKKIKITDRIKTSLKKMAIRIKHSIKSIQTICLYIFFLEVTISN